MEQGLMLLAAVLAIAVAFAISYGSKASWRSTLTDFATRHDLELLRGGFGSADRAVGDLDGLGVTVDSYVVRHGKSSVTYGRVAVDTDLPGDVTISSEGFGSALSKVFRGQDVAVGDDAFDARAHMRGDEVELVSRLGAEARAALEVILMGSARVEGGALVDSRRGFYKSADEIEAALEPLLEVARLLRDPRPAPQRLAALATADPEPGVRARALTLLAERFPRARETAASARAALGDPSGAVRLAAIDLAPDDPEVRRALAATLSDGQQASALRLVAARRLAELVPDDPALEAHHAWFIAALDVDDVRESPGHLLGFDGYLVDAIVAAEVLGACGGIDAVEALLAHTRGVFKDGRLKDAAREAIDAIQARASGSAGALSLTGAAPAGGLSVAESPDEAEA